MSEYHHQLWIHINIRLIYSHETTYIYNNKHYQWNNVEHHHANEFTWCDINIKKSNRYTAFQYMHKEQSKTITTVSSALTTSRNRVPFILKFNLMLYKHDMKTWLWYQLKENLVLYPIQNTQRKRQTWIYFIHDW